MTKEKTIYSIIMKSLNVCTRMTKASKVDEATRVTKLILKIEDNPVPSIDKKLIDSLKDMFYASSCLKQSTSDDVWKLIKILQNGVETDNEQPNNNRN